MQHAGFNLEGGLCFIKTISISLSLKLVSVLLLGDFQAQTSQKCNWRSHFHTTKCMLVRRPSKSQTMSLVIITKKNPSLTGIPRRSRIQVYYKKPWKAKRATSGRYHNKLLVITTNSKTNFRKKIHCTETFLSFSLQHMYREGEDTSQQELLVQLLRKIWKYLQLSNFTRMGLSSR